MNCIHLNFVSDKEGRKFLFPILPQDGLNEKTLNVVITDGDSQRIYPVFQQKAGIYEDYSEYMTRHGCACCSLTTALAAFVEKYADLKPNGTISEVERKHFPEEVYTENYGKVMARQMPVSLYGISLILQEEGVSCEYIGDFEDKAAEKQMICTADFDCTLDLGLAPGSRMRHIIVDVVRKIALDAVSLCRIETSQYLILFRLMRCRELLACEPVAAEHRMDEFQVREFFEHTAEKLPAKGRRLIDYTTKFPAQIRELIDGLPVDRQWSMMHDDRDLQIIQHLQIRLESRIIQIELPIMTGQLHTDHAKLFEAALQLIEIFLAAPGRQDRVGVQAAVGTPAHIRRIIIDDLAGVEPQPFLPHRHAQESGIYTGIIHGPELGLQGIIPLYVIQIMIALRLLQNQMLLAVLHFFQRRDLAKAARCRRQKSVHHFLIRKKVLWQMMHIAIDNHLNHPPYFIDN